MAKWIVSSSSVQGKGHITRGIPCQDAHTVRLLEHGWGVAVVCDGAGSYENSHIGATFTANQTCALIAKAILSEKWTDDTNFIPSSDQWRNLAIETLQSIAVQLEQYAETCKLSYHSLGCTVIVTIFSPHCLLTAHIGDGRGAYRDSQGQWLASFTPYKGEEASSTVFITLPIWDELDEYLETRVVVNEIRAVVLMSDGCEKASFITNALSRTFFDKLVPQIKSKDSMLADRVTELVEGALAGKIDIMELANAVLQGCALLGKEPDSVVSGHKMMHDANLPHEKYFTALMDKIKSLAPPDKLLEEELRNGLAYSTEQDDKTMVIASLVQD